MSRRNRLAAVAAVTVAAVVATITLVVERESGSRSPDGDLSAGTGAGTGNGGSEPRHAGSDSSGSRAGRSTIAIARASLDSAGQLVLVYFVGMPGCYGQLGRTVIEQHPSSVTVTLVSGPEPTASDTPCMDVAMARRTGIELDRPLAGRILIDGSTGHPVTVG